MLPTADENRAAEHLSETSTCTLIVVIIVKSSVQNQYFYSRFTGKTLI